MTINLSTPCVPNYSKRNKKRNTPIKTSAAYESSQEIILRNQQKKGQTPMIFLVRSMKTGIFKIN